MCYQCLSTYLWASLCLSLLLLFVLFPSTLRSFIYYYVDLYLPSFFISFLPFPYFLSSLLFLISSSLFGTCFHPLRSSLSLLLSLSPLLVSPHSILLFFSSPSNLVSCSLLSSSPLLLLSLLSSPLRYCFTRFLFSSPIFPFLMTSFFSSLIISYLPFISFTPILLFPLFSSSPPNLFSPFCLLSTLLLVSSHFSFSSCHLLLLFRLLSCPLLVNMSLFSL